MRRILLLSFCFLSFVAIISCSKADKFAGCKDFYMSQKTPLKKTPQTIVSVSPAVTEILFELGCGDKLIGRTDFCTYPAQATKITSIGGINNSNLEKIIALRPDLVITSSIFTQKMFSRIEEAGIPIMSFKETHTIEGMCSQVEVIGKICDRQMQAQAIITNFKCELQEIKNAYLASGKFNGGKKKPTLYYVVGFGQGGDFTAGKDTYINEIITLAGAENSASDAVNWSYSQENLFKNQPDYILVRYEDSARFVTTQPYSNLKAVKAHRVFGIETSLMDIQTPRTIQAIRYISNIIHSK